MGSNGLSRRKMLSLSGGSAITAVFDWKELSDDWSSEVSSLVVPRNAIRTIGRPSSFTTDSTTLTTTSETTVTATPTANESAGIDIDTTEEYVVDRGEYQLIEWYEGGALVFKPGAEMVLTG